MRIVGGKFAGRHLTPPAEQRVRPTAEHVRVAIVEMLAADVSGARVLELFAGTGAVGLEMLSHGAKWADFVETRPSSLHALRANVAALRVRQRARIFKRDALPFAAGLAAGAYDVAFADPPYESRMLDRLVEGWIVTPFARVLVVEHARGHEPGARMAPARREEFEETVVSVYRAALPREAPAFASRR